MQRALRRALDTSYARLGETDVSPTTFASNYALSLGIIVGGEACGGMTESEAVDERAHLGMLAALYEVRTRVRSDLNAR
jgi:hypothetical protein